VQTGHELNVRLRGKSSSFDLMNNKFLKNSWTAVQERV
jgi:hypothetical protein